MGPWEGSELGLVAWQVMGTRWVIFDLAGEYVNPRGDAWAILWLRRVWSVFVTMAGEVAPFSTVLSFTYIESSLGERKARGL